MSAEIQQQEEVHSYCETPLPAKIIDGVEYATPVDNFRDLCCPKPPSQDVQSKKALKRAALREKTKEKFRQKKEQKRLEKRRKLEGQTDVSGTTSAESATALTPEKLDNPSNSNNNLDVSSEVDHKPDGDDKETSAEVSKVVDKSTNDSVAPTADEKADASLQKQKAKVSWKEGFLQRCKKNPKVVIDLEFGNVMRREEINSLTQQVMYCYGLNKRADEPVDLVLTGLEGLTEQRLQNIDGFQDWACRKEAKHYAELYPKKDLVYLTADADEIITELNPNDVYIIGGIVDRNRLKNCTFRKAQKQGIRTAKLPIAEHVTMSATKVLTVNCVLDIMCKQLHYKDWKKTFHECLPGRKNAEIDEVEPDE